MKLTTASLVLSGVLAAGTASADNKVPLLNEENIKPPVLNTENIQNDVVTLYADATSINIAQVVESETRTVLFSTWCKENPEACKRLDEEKSKSNSESESKSNPTNVSVIVKGKTYGLGLETEQVYIEATSNFKDEVGVGAAYKFESGAITGVSYADKKDVGSQTGVGAGYVKSFDNSYVGAGVKYTDFNAKGIYADADSVKAQIMGAYELTPGLFAEAGVSYKTFKADTYDRESRVEGSLGLAYMTPDFTARIGGTINQTSNQVMATLSFPIGGKNKVGAANLGQSNMARFIADSSFDNSIVRVKKVPVVAPVSPVVPATFSNIPNIIEGDERGKNYNLDFSGYCTNCNGGTFSASGLPNGLSIDPNTGIVTGFFDASAFEFGWDGNSNVHNVVISYTKNGVVYNSNTFVWDITDEG